MFCLATKTLNMNTIKSQNVIMEHGVAKQQKINNHSPDRAAYVHVANTAPSRFKLGLWVYWISGYAIQIDMQVAEEPIYTGKYYKFVAVCIITSTQQQ